MYLLLSCRIQASTHFVSVIYTDSQPTGQALTKPSWAIIWNIKGFQYKTRLDFVILSLHLSLSLYIYMLYSLSMYIYIYNVCDKRTGFSCQSLEPHRLYGKELCGFSAVNPGHKKPIYLGIFEICTHTHTHAGASMSQTTPVDRQAGSLVCSHEAHLGLAFVPCPTI